MKQIMEEFGELKKVRIKLDRYGYQQQVGKKKNTKTFQKKIKFTLKTATINTISKNIKNINHMKNNGKTTVK